MADRLKRVAKASFTETGGPLAAFFRILVTGADGFVGRYLVPVLAANISAQAEITLASRDPRADATYPEIAFDLENPAIIASAIRSTRPDLVIHLAAQASIGEAGTDAAATWSLNFCGSLALARAVAEFSPDCTFFYVSSAEVYGQTFNDSIADENSPLRPQSAYSRAKAAAEGMLLDVLPKTARLIVARPSNHSGPGQDQRFVIPAFAAQIARIEAGAPPEIWVGNLEASRDFLDVRDVVAAYVALLARAADLPPRSTFNIGSGQIVSIQMLLDMLMAQSPHNQAEVIVDPKRMRASDVPRAEIDASRLREATGWAPKYTIQDTLLDVLAEYRRQLSTG
jgi:GDP-4-dehydro-6-deoxy-D-mannose reductase